MTAWPEQTWYVWGLFVLAAAGAMLPIRTERRDDFPMMAIAVMVAAAVTGAGCLVVLWAAALVAVPVRVAWSLVPRRGAAEGWPGAKRSLVWLGISTLACTVGFVVGGGVYVALGHQFPVTFGSTGDYFAAYLAAIGGWVGTMVVVVLAVRRVNGPIMASASDPFESMSVPYVLPVLVGFPLVVASVAIFQMGAPVPSLFILWWCLPTYAATALDVHRRRMGQELRRDAMAAQRLAAIGEVSARLVHQSRHQVGLMGWSIHRLRALTDPGPGQPLDRAAIERELAELTAAKDRLSVMLASELLHEADPDRAEGPSSPAATSRRLRLAAVIDEVADQLAAEAEREGVALHRTVADDVADEPVAPALADAVFNLVDNAIDAAAGDVEVVAERHDATVVLTVLDDGAGFPGEAATRAFEPFFTTKADGTGMGLAIVDALVGDLGGEVRHERRGDRTAVVVALPMAVPPPVISHSVVG
ncbi:MAG: HAMP domain-containing sensor histidine kinase [Acidimicrobiales bacterium]